MANLTFKSNGATQVALNKINSPYTTTIQYSKNGGAWSNVQFGNAISLSNNETVSFSGNARFSKNIQNKYQFTTAGEGTLTLSGDLVSLVSGTTLEDDYEFNSLFKDCENIVNASQLTLPSNTTNWCYTNMFFGCTNIQVAPYLPAPNTVYQCYQSMFQNCSKLSAVAVNFTNWNYYEDQNEFKLYYTDAWLNGTAANGSFYKPPSLPTYRGQNFIPIGWTVYNK